MKQHSAAYKWVVLAILMVRGRKTGDAPGE